MNARTKDLPATLPGTAGSTLQALNDWIAEVATLTRPDAIHWCDGSDEENAKLVAHEARSHIIYSELLKALDHPVVRPVIERVSARRLEYLTASFRQAGLNRADAQHRARLAYAAYVGFLQLNLQMQQPRLQHDEFEAYVEHVMATLIPA